jgi:hypothetical protein
MTTVERPYTRLLTVNFWRKNKQKRQLNYWRNSQASISTKKYYEMHAIGMS